jgi:hypothetical protein
VSKLKKLAGLVASGLGSVLLIGSFASVTLADSEDSPPKGYITICHYNKSCALAKPSLVAFGSHGQYAYKLISGSFLCSERTFNRAPISVEAANCSVAVTKGTAESKGSAIQSVADIKNGTYAIISRLSGKALEVTDSGLLRQSPYAGKLAQQFTISSNNDGFIEITASDGKAFEVKDWQVADGAKILTAVKVDSWGQQWRLENATAGYFTITSRFNSKALDLFGMNTNTGAEIRLWTYWGGENQHWQLIAIDPTKRTAIEF